MVEIVGVQVKSTECAENKAAEMFCGNAVKLLHRKCWWGWSEEVSSLLHRSYKHTVSDEPAGVTGSFYREAEPAALWRASVCQSNGNIFVGTVRLCGFCGIITSADRAADTAQTHAADALRNTVKHEDTQWNSIAYL